MRLLRSVSSAITRPPPPLRRAVLGAAALLLTAAPLEGLQTHPHPADAEDAWVRLETSPRHAEWVALDAGGGDRVSAWVVYPDRDDPAPVVVLVHESVGATEWTQNVADQLAAQGYLAVVPDLLTGRTPGGVLSRDLPSDEAIRLVSGLTWDVVSRRLDATVRYATGLAAGSGRVAVMGFCWGGDQAFRYATVRPELDAAVIFYGAAPDTAAAAGIRAPVLGLFGGSDARVTETIPPLIEWRERRKELDSVPWVFEHEIYPGAGHGFLRHQSGRDGANLAAAREGWRAAVAFLREWLDP